MALFYRYSAVFNQWLLWHQPLETEIGTRSGYFTFWIRSTNTAAHTAMTMEMANAGV